MGEAPQIEIDRVEKDTPATPATFALMTIGFAASPAPGTKTRACALALRARAPAPARPAMIRFNFPFVFMVRSFQLVDDGYTVLAQ